MIDVIEVLENLVKFNTIKDKENKEILKNENWGQSPILSQNVVDKIKKKT